jgi:Tfp pilus assembly protein PilO
VTESRKTLISVIIVIAALLGVTTWLVLGIRESRRLDGSITEKGARLQKLNEKIAAVPALRQQQQKLATELEEYETILPNDRELNKIFDTLSKYEQKAGLKNKTFNPSRDARLGTSGSESLYKQVSYDLELSGDYFSLAKFLNQLENHDRFVQVDTFSVKQKSQENGPVNEISLKLSTFVFDAKAQPVRRTGAEGPVKGANGGGVGARNATPETPFDLKQELANRYVYRDDPRRRDPFTSPLTRRINVAKFEPTTPKRTMTPEQEKAACDSIDKQLMEAAKLISDTQLEVAEKLLSETKTLMEGDFRDATCAARQPGFSRQMQRLRIMLRTARGEQLYQIVEENYDKMKKAFDRGDYDEVNRVYDNVKVMLGRDAKDAKSGKDPAGAKTASTKSDPAGEANAGKGSRPGAESKDMDDEGEPIHDRLSEAIKACEMLCERAGVRREFAGIPIQIQGTFWSAKTGERRAAAIINGQTLSEGERVSPSTLGATEGSRKPVRAEAAAAAEIIVQKIDREKVTFLYRNESIEKYQFAQE